MKDNKKVSVIVPVYNTEEYISKCLESICEQTYKNIEIICIDDGSKDYSADIIKKMQTKDKRIRYYYKNNSGPSSARNLGIEKVSGNFILFVDADDYIDKNAIETLIRIKNNNLTILRRSKDKNITSPPQFLKIDEYLNKIFTNEIGGYITGILFEREKVSDLRFDENTKYMEDTIFLIEYLNKSNIKEVIITSSESCYNLVTNKNGLTDIQSKSSNRVRQYSYSLDKINKITNYKYNDEIQYKKIVFLEADMSMILDAENFDEFYNDIKIESTKNKNSLRYNIFYYLYIGKRLKLLKLYYKIKKNIKKLRRV